jgi:hypothetical protein
MPGLLSSIIRQKNCAKYFLVDSLPDPMSQPCHGVVSGLNSISYGEKSKSILAIILPSLQPFSLPLYDRWAWHYSQWKDGFGVVQWALKIIWVQPAHCVVKDIGTQGASTPSQLLAELGKDLPPIGAFLPRTSQQLPGLYPMPSSATALKGHHHPVLESGEGCHLSHDLSISVAVGHNT